LEFVTGNCNGGTIDDAFVEIDFGAGSAAKNAFGAPDDKDDEDDEVDDDDDDEDEEDDDEEDDDEDEEDDDIVEFVVGTFVAKNGASYCEFHAIEVDDG
jgi:ribosomal protein L12E/L44/L45/RPP1/RPP2